VIVGTGRAGGGGPTLFPVAACDGDIGVVYAALRDEVLQQARQPYVDVGGNVIVMSRRRGERRCHVVAPSCAVVEAGVLS
jgi:hypothetical protein